MQDKVSPISIKPIFIGLFIGFFLIVKCQAQKNPEREFIEGQYEDAGVIYDGSEQARAALFKMPSSLLPFTPEGYKWWETAEGYVLKKNINMPDHTIEVVLYGPDERGRLNYLTMIDDVNRQSFAHCRLQAFPADRRKYPFNARKAYQVKGFNRYHLPGHCVDHADTLEIVGQLLSTYDARNFIPEPPRSTWGLQVRNNLVKTIRKEKGGYMQVPYYEEAPLKTANGTAVPSGVYFAEIYNNSISKVYDVTWDNPITRDADHKYGKSYATANLLSSNAGNFYPAALSYKDSLSDQELEKQVGINAALSQQLLCAKTEYNFSAPHCYYNLRAAEDEFRTPYHKIELAINYSEYAINAAMSKVWLKRAKLHAKNLQGIDEKRELITQRQFNDFEWGFSQEDAGFEDPTDSDRDFWRMIYKNHLD